MGQKKRIIASLDIKNEKLVKGIGMEGLRQIGMPEHFAKIYYEEGIDEIYFRDVVASLYDQNTIKSVVSKTAKRCFIPIIVGGGIRTLKDIEEILRAGGDKVAINSAGVKQPNFLKKAVDCFGASTISVQVDTQTINGIEKVVIESGRTITDIKTVDWITKTQELGVGEIILTSVDLDGTGKGFNFEFLEKIRDLTSAPLVVAGGAGAMCHLTRANLLPHVSGIGLASILHSNYNVEVSGVNRIRKYEISNTKNVESISIKEIKKSLNLPNRVKKDSGELLLKPAIRKSQKKVGILDYGAGNIYSVANALVEVGAEPELVKNESHFNKIDALVIPGVGEFENAMRKLKSNNLVQPVIDYFNEGKKILGICLGMQLLFDGSDESPNCAGLSIIKGRCRLLPEKSGKVPNIGWCYVDEKDGTNATQMYFIHSYYVELDNPMRANQWYTNLKRFSFPAMIKYEHLMACQFHPELSGKAGLKLLDNWLTGIA